MSPTAEELARDLRDDLLDEVREDVPDEVAFGFTTSPSDNERSYMQVTDEEQAIVDASVRIVEVASKEPYENDDPEVYGIAFPKTMLPLGAMAGTWTADEIRDLEGGTDEVFVRVWLCGPEKT